MDITFLIKRNKSKKQRLAVSKYWKGRARIKFLGDWRKNKLRILSKKEVLRLNKKWLQLLGWILTDGTIEKKRGKIVIYQKKEEGKEKIRKILLGLKLQYKEYQTKDGTIMFYIIAKYSRKILEKLALNKNKNLPKWTQNLLRKQTLWFLEAVIDGDGHRRKYDTSIAGTEKRLKEFVWLFRKKDISCSINQNTRGNWNLGIHQKVWQKNV